MKHKTLYIYAVVLILGFNVAGCDKNDNIEVNSDMVEIDGVALQLGGVDLSSGTAATTRATVAGIDYAVNTNEDPTSSFFFLGSNNIREDWKLDFSLYNGNASGSVDGTPYDAASFTAGVYDDTNNTWKPSPDKQLLFPNYFKPHVEAWLYPSTKDAAVATDQSTEEQLIAQDILHRAKSVLPGNATESFGKKLSVQLSHQRAMLNFKFQDIVREDINEVTVKVKVGGTDYTPYSVRAAGVLEYMLILPEATPAATEIIVEYVTVGNDLLLPIEYKHKVNLGITGALGSNNCYCFTLSPKEMTISPVSVINWVTGEPVLGEYVAVTAYPTFKGPKNETYYFYYDNQLTEDGSLNGTPKLQEINFNNDGECTIKPDGRIITHIFKGSDPTMEDWNLYKLDNPIILGNTEKIYIDLETIINTLYP
ncbi:hypothetical protein PSM36_3402 [Proteiniphilum saccharofermentans]|uniref:Uncharacterized protein n=1 Tax=Proteiniphilum saccharofermentans TaxID=1642647 RepID=A0A1R3T196_9BACT|nr:MULTISPECIES: hypothetical protein [Proteiniphilum]SCD22186.1 hypothetical protein PSM36_3402 [Proteiniphilum saccharofermentans]SFK54507.1 hypothetical protein SAMN05216357_10343 [Porphyromonadaceae bacterium KH3CP3RA]